MVTPKNQEHLATVRGDTQGVLEQLWRFGRVQVRGVDTPLLRVHPNDAGSV